MQFGQSLSCHSAPSVVRGVRSVGGGEPEDWEPESDLFHDDSTLTRNFKKKQRHAAPVQDVSILVLDNNGRYMLLPYLGPVSHPVQSMSNFAERAYSSYNRTG